MITNSSVTIYHKGFDKTHKIETWERHNYPDVWFFGGKGARFDKGYDNANDVQIRIPLTSSHIIKELSIGDIIVQGTVNKDIETQQDLSNYDIYKITTIKNNTLGNNPHIHIGGK